MAPPSVRDQVNHLICLTVTAQFLMPRRPFLPAEASCPIGCRSGTATLSWSSATWRWGLALRASTWSLGTGARPTLYLYGTACVASAFLASWQVKETLPNRSKVENGLCLTYGKHIKEIVFSENRNSPTSLSVLAGFTGFSTFLRALWGKMPHDKPQTNLD